MKISAVGDIHCDIHSKGKLRHLFQRMQEQSDVLLLCGDLTDHGLVEEAEILSDEIASTIEKPLLAVLGNHDFDAGAEKIICEKLKSAGCHLMDGDSEVIAGVGFAGVKGFGGGFDIRSLESLGESTIKQFVREVVEETLKLEAALSRLHDIPRIVLMHYSPIRETVVGESPEIYPFLGSKRLEDPLNHYHVVATFHGHAHHGTLHGQTSTGLSVFNVAQPLLEAKSPSRTPFKIFEMEAHHE